MKPIELENSIVSSIKTNSYLPDVLPDWLINLGVVPGKKILKAIRIGDKSPDNKTDVLINIKDSEPIKISAKLSNAHYFGNWYTHERILKEFSSENILNKQIKAATEWANKWLYCTTNNAPFVGVSICYGERSGKTGEDFTNVYNAKDIITIATGFGNGTNVANCLYSSDYAPKNIDDLLNNLMEINEYNILKLTGKFKIAYRPINPMTEGSNRGKQIYTMFQPFEKLDNPTTFTSASQLREVGKFVEVEPLGSIRNHNHVLNHLKTNYNVIIPKK